MSSGPVYEATFDYPELAYSQTFPLRLSGLRRNSIAVIPHSPINPSCCCRV